MADRRTDQVDLASTPDFEIGGLQVHPASREIAKGDHRETLQPRVMQVLVALAQEPGEVVSDDRLFARCWEGRIVGDDALHRVMARVRRIGEAQNAFSIQSIAKVGYRLTVAGGDEAATRPARKAPRWLWPALGVAAAAGLAIGFWLLRPAEPVRVVVQDFTLTPASAEGAAVAGRVRDQIVSTLTARQVNVSTATPRPQTAGLVIGGVVEEAAGVARIRIHVDEPRSKVVVWNRVFEGPSQPDGALAEQAAAKITDIVGNGYEVLRSGKGEVSPEALKSLMLGLDAWRQGQVLEPREFYRGFKEAAPKSSVAQARFALSTAQALNSIPVETARTWRQEANQSVDRALSLNPHEPGAYYALYILKDATDYSGRRAVMRKALQMAPLDGSLNVNTGILLTELGRPTEGMAYIRKGFVNDPLSPPKSFGIAVNLAGVGEIDEARTYLRRASKIWPHTQQERDYLEFFAVEYAEQAEARAILADLSKTYPDFPPKAAIWTAYLDSLACRCGGAAVAKTIVTAGGAYRIDVDLAIAALTRLGDLDDAFALANSRLPTGRARGSNLLFSVVMRPLRQDRRFMDLAQHLKLVDYWRNSGEWPEYCAEPGLPYDCKTEAARRAGKP